MASPFLSQLQYSESDTPHHRHYHLSCEMVFVEEGKAEFIINGKRYIAQKGSLLFINSYEQHETHILRAPYRRYFAIVTPTELEYALSPSVLPGIFKNRPAGFRHCVVLSGYTEEVSRLFGCLLREYHHNSPFSNRMTRILLEQILIYVYRACPENFAAGGGSLQDRLRQIQQYIEIHFREEIKISHLADQYFLNHCYLTHKFKEQVGYSPKQYILLNRLSYAKELLETTDEQISQIAFQCGFGDVNNFSRAFRQWFSTTPREYRESKR